MSKKLFLSVLIAGFSFSSLVSAKEDSNPMYKEKAEMRVTHELNCSDVGTISPEYSPADLYNAAAKCIQENNYDSAFKFIGVAGVFENYDFKRVRDTQNLGYVKTILKTKFLGTLPQDFKIFIMRNAQGDRNTKTCDFVKKIGTPKYHPYYITSYGVQNGEERSLRESFDSDIAITESLNKFLMCNYEVPKEKVSEQ